MDTDAADQAAPAAAAGQAAEAEASPFSKRLALFKVRWMGGGAGSACHRDCHLPNLALHTCHLLLTPYLPVQTILNGDVPIELERQFLAPHTSFI